MLKTDLFSYSPKQSSRVSRIEEEYKSDESISGESETEGKEESKGSTKMIDSEMNQITKRIKERELRYLVSSSNNFGGKQEEQTSDPGGILTAIKQRAADERGSKRYIYFKLYYMHYYLNLMPSLYYCYTISTGKRRSQPRKVAQHPKLSLC